MVKERFWGLTLFCKHQAFWNDLDVSGGSFTIPYKVGSKGKTTRSLNTQIWSKMTLRQAGLKGRGISVGRSLLNSFSFLGHLEGDNRISLSSIFLYSGFAFRFSAL